LYATTDFREEIVYYCVAAMVATCRHCGKIFADDWRRSIHVGKMHGVGKKRERTKGDENNDDEASDEASSDADKIKMDEEDGHLFTWAKRTIAFTDRFSFHAGALESIREFVALR